MLAVFLSQPRDSSKKKKGEQVVLHFDPSFCVPTLTTKNVHVRVVGKARFLAYMVLGYSFPFGSTYVRPRKWTKIHKYLSQNRKIYGIKILNKKEKLLKKDGNAYLTLLYLSIPQEAFPRSHSKLCDLNERLDGLPSREPLLSDNKQQF